MMCSKVSVNQSKSFDMCRETRRQTKNKKLTLSTMMSTRFPPWRRHRAATPASCEKSSLKSFASPAAKTFFFLAAQGHNAIQQEKKKGGGSGGQKEKGRRKVQMPSKKKKGFKAFYSMAAF
jgi:hypothetical protein